MNCFKLCSFQINFWVGTAVSAAPDQPPLAVDVFTTSPAPPRGDTTGHRTGQEGGELRQAATTPANTLYGPPQTTSRPHWTIRTNTASTERGATDKPL
ncbi:hypothetical protein MTP99_005723 [Tenebrio molitor]|nr:hypothetical protein MTP99_005723 [Tenebrio molitor]